MPPYGCAPGRSSRPIRPCKPCGRPPALSPESLVRTPRCYGPRKRCASLSDPRPDGTVVVGRGRGAREMEHGLTRGQSSVDVGANRLDVTMLRTSRYDRVLRT